MRRNPRGAQTNAGLAPGGVTIAAASAEAGVIPPSVRLKRANARGGAGTGPNPGATACQIARTCSACGPLAPRVTVYSTRWLSWRLR